MIAPNGSLLRKPCAKYDKFVIGEDVVEINAANIAFRARRNFFASKLSNDLKMIQRDYAQLLARN